MRRVQRAAQSVWWSVAQTGLLWGVGAAFLALVGLVEVLSRRQIIAGVLSLAYAFLLLAGLGAGVQASRRLATGGSGRRLAGGVLAGTLAGVIVAGLIVVGQTVNLRPMLVNASPALFDVLSFGLGSSGIGFAIVVQAIAGGVGAAIPLLPGRLRGPLIAGLGTVFGVGL